MNNTIEQIFLEWWDKNLGICEAQLTNENYFKIDLDNITSSCCSNEIPFTCKGKPKPKDIEIWYDYTYRTFDLEDSWEFLSGKSIAHIQINKIGRDKSYLLKTFMDLIFPAFLNTKYLHET